MDANDVALYWAMAAFEGGHPSNEVITMLHFGNWIAESGNTWVAEVGFTAKFRELEIKWQAFTKPAPKKRLKP